MLTTILLLLSLFQINVLLHPFVAVEGFIFDYPTAVSKFTADFTISLNYNFTFSAQVPGYNPPPFLEGPEIMPLQGKVAFNYETAQARIEWSAGDGAPWKIGGTTIVHSSECSRGLFSFNCTLTTFQTAGENRCWSTTQSVVDIPNDMGSNLNLTYEGVRQYDGFECMFWVDVNSGTTYIVRLTDLAIVEVDVPEGISQSIPLFSFLGFAGVNTTIRFTSIVVGEPDPSNFNVPSGICIDVGPVGKEEVVFNDIPAYLLDSLQQQNGFMSAGPFFNQYVAKKFFTISQKMMSHMEEAGGRGVEAPKRQKRNTNQGPIPPRLHQAFTADWILNASTDLTPPYTPYTLSGKLAFDLTTSGLAWSIESSTGNIPLDVQLELRIVPDEDGVELIQVGPGGEASCYGYIFLQWIFTFLVPQFEVPYDSAEEGPAIVNGDQCTVWQTTYDWYEQFSELYVRDRDHQLVQVTLPEPFGHGLATVTLTNILPHVDPSRYSKPAQCVEVMKWNPSWESHLPWDWCDPFC